MVDFQRPISNIFDLNEVFTALLERGNPEGRLILHFISQGLRQFRLEGVYETDNILIEVYLRACRYLEKDKPIRKLTPWIRGTAYNVIRELSRRQRMFVYVELDDNIPDNSEDKAEEGFQESYDIINSALGKLSEEDRKLLIWKYVDGLSWEEISQRLVDAGEYPRSYGALRKWGQRVKKRLRKLYEEVDIEERQAEKSSPKVPTRKDFKSSVIRPAAFWSGAWSA